LSKLQTLSEKEIAIIKEVFIRNLHARFMKYFFPYMLFGTKEAYAKKIMEAYLEGLHI
jgi:hypothetical protein